MQKKDFFISGKEFQRTSTVSSPWRLLGSSVQDGRFLVGCIYSVGSLVGGVPVLVNLQHPHPYLDKDIKLILYCISLAC